MLDPSSAAPVHWPEASSLPLDLRWLSRLGVGYGPRRVEAARHFDLPPVEAVAVETLPELQSWLLVEAWWRGVLPTDRIVDMLGEDPNEGIEQALADADVVEQVWFLLRPSELDGVGRWGAEVLRNHGADAVCCRESGVIVFLASTAGVRVIDPEPEDRPDPILLSETEPPGSSKSESTPKLKKAKPKPPKPARSVDGIWAAPGVLMESVGLLAESALFASPWQCDSLLELRREVLLDGLDQGVLRYANLRFAFERIDVDLHEDEVRDSLVDHAEQLEVHVELALQSAAFLRERLRRGGYDGIVFRRDDVVLVLPHYYLRGLTQRQIWRRICGG